MTSGTGVGAWLLLTLLGFGPHSMNGPVADVAFVRTRLGLDLAVDYGRGALDGTATLELRNGSTTAAAAIPLILNRLMVVADVRTAEGATLSFEQRVTLFQDDSTRQVNAITINPARPIPPGGTITVVVRYGGVLVGYQETGSLYIQDHVSRDFTIIREDAYAFPVVGVLSTRANRAAARESFAFTARITVPAGLVVAMGGEATEPVRQDLLSTWSYRSEAPVPFLNITIAPYSVLVRADARIYFFPADSVGALTVAQGITGAVDRLTQWYGPLGRHPKLVVMEIPEGFGSQASLAAGILQTAAAFADRSELRQLYHELSHIWNVPDLERPSPRWNEGFASFTQYRMAAELDGWTDWDSAVRRALASIARECGTAASRCDTVPFAAYGRAAMTDQSYLLGMLLFHILYRVLGAEDFDRAYRNFFQVHRDGGGATADLVAAFNGTSKLSGAILDDWLLTTRWRTKLSSGATIEQLIESYRR